MNQLILNGKKLREALNISTTLFYKFLKNGMPYHQISGGRKYYIFADCKIKLNT